MNRTTIAALVAVTALLPACGVDAPSAPAPPGTSASTEASPVPARVTRPSLVVNKDGSAVVTAYVQNVQATETSLTGITVLSGDDPLKVLTTQMSMPLPPDTELGIGYATDAGGFVVPEGVSVGGSYRLVLGFDNGTCRVVVSEATGRTAEHRAIYPRTKGFSGAVLSPQQAAGDCAGG